jgi:hydroxyethylthiazole kinase
MTDRELAERAALVLERLRETRPLVHHITNFVVMNDTANVTLHVGASPVMAHAKQEVVEMVAMAGVLVLNPGTLEPDWVEAMLLAGRRANERGIPIVLDPVGAGATGYRTETNQHLLRELRPAIVRGNAGEIGSLAGTGGEVKGVDSIGAPDRPEQTAMHAARTWSTVVAITGERDLISDGERLLAVDNGDRWLTTLTGTGCIATTIVGAFAAVEPDHLLAAAAALSCYGLAAELAAKEAQGPASFKAALFDELYRASAPRLVEGARIREITAGDPV